MADTAVAAANVGAGPDQHRAAGEPDGDGKADLVVYRAVERDLVYALLGSGLQHRDSGRVPMGVAGRRPDLRRLRWRRKDRTDASSGRRTARGTSLLVARLQRREQLDAFSGGCPAMSRSPATSTATGRRISRLAAVERTWYIRYSSLGLAPPLWSLPMGAAGRCPALGRFRRRR